MTELSKNRIGPVTEPLVVLGEGNLMLIDMIYDEILEAPKKVAGVAETKCQQRNILYHRMAAMT